MKTVEYKIRFVGDGRPWFQIAVAHRQPVLAATQHYMNQARDYAYSMADTVNCAVRIQYKIDGFGEAQYVYGDGEDVE